MTAPVPVPVVAKANRCTVQRAASTLDESARENFLDVIDGINGYEEVTPFEAALHGQKNGFRLTAPIVRRHRRRIDQTGEHCWCPVR